jgi:inositol transport system substrate-binding protein
MLLSRRVLLAAVFASSLPVAVASAKDLTILTSVPGLNFPFFVHMMKAMKTEVTAQGAAPLESDGQNNAPKQTADQRC